jgi:hypothetical protein
VEKYGRARQATDDNIIWHIHFVCWVTKATDTRNMKYLLLLHGSANACQCYLMCTLPVLYGFKYSNFVAFRADYADIRICSTENVCVCVCAGC